MPVRRANLALAAATVMLLGSVSTLDAQIPSVDIGIGAGPSLPTGDLAEETDPGVRVQGSIGLDLAPSPLALRADVAYDRIPDKAGHGDYGIVSGVANVIYRLQGVVVTPYVLAGTGIFRISEPEAHEAADAGTRLGFNVATGLDLRLAGFTLFIESKWQHIATEGGATRIVPIVVGLKR